MDFETVFSEMPELEALLGSFTFLPALVVIIACIALAFYGTRLFKACITLVGTVFFGEIGNTVVAGLIFNALGDAALEIPFNIAAVIGFVFAAIGFLLSYKLYKFAIFLFGGAIGYTIGTTVAGIIAVNNPDVEFLTSEMFFIIAPVVCAALVGIITLFVFKFLYIFATSFTGMCTASMAACLTVYPDTVGLILFSVLGVVLSIVAMVYQFKNSEDM